MYQLKDTFLCSLTQAQLTALCVDKETFKVVAAVEFIIVVVCHRVLQIMYDSTQSVQRETAAALDALPLITLFKTTTVRLWNNNEMFLQTFPHVSQTLLHAKDASE